ANSKTYGDADPVGLTTGSSAASPNNFLAGDGVSAVYTRAAGENASPPTYHITATLSSTVAGADGKYTITNLGNEFTISTRVVTWITDASSKTYGDADPAGLTTGASAASPNNFLAGDGVSAVYSRAAAENASPPTYHITATLSSTVAG